MADAKNKVKDIDDEVGSTREELNLDVKVNVRSLAGWNVGFARIQDGTGDVTITPNSTMRLSRNEIIAQIQNNNRLFVGTDGKGSHATLYIDDAPTRYEVDFEQKGQPQKFLTEKVVKELFSLNQREFENRLSQEVCTRAEKYAVIEIIRKLKINDYAKIRYTENYTGYSL